MMRQSMYNMYNMYYSYMFTYILCIINNNKIKHNENRVMFKFSKKYEFGFDINNDCNAKISYTLDKDDKTKLKSFQCQCYFFISFGSEIGCWGGIYQTLNVSTIALSVNKSNNAIDSYFDCEMIKYLDIEGEYVE